MTAALRSLRKIFSRRPSWNADVTHFEQFRDALARACATDVARHPMA